VAEIVQTDPEKCLILAVFLPTNSNESPAGFEPAAYGFEVGQSAFKHG
jgi:hypothetical protein